MTILTCFLSVAPQILQGREHPNGQLRSRPWGTREFSIVDPSGVCIAFVEQDARVR